jgi:aspartyl-tRNA(Asn)/glutamyl-tRNA(Gln) amidotransferase subunit A
VGAGLTELTALELRDAYRRRHASPVEAIDESSARIEAGESTLNAWTTLALDEARVQARAAERAWGRGEARALEGIPLGVKDLFDTKDLRTTYGSPMFDRNVPAADAAAVTRAKEAGAIVVGKTATDEFAYGIAGVNPHYGAPRNPWRHERVSGGSSSGSAVALAARQVPLALGSDTGGSIRVPAGFCGVVGFKGTWGVVPTAGMWPMGRTIDHVGPMARTPADAALLHAVLVDGVRGAPIAAMLQAGLPPAPDGLRIGICPDLTPAPPAPDVARAVSSAIEALEERGASAVEVRFPEAGRLVATFVAIRDAETLHTHRRAGLFPARRDRYGPLTAARLDAASEVGIDDYLGACALRAQAAAGLDRIFEAVDVLVLPLAAGSPPALEAPAPDEEAWELVHRSTVPFNVLGVPACVVRAGFDALGLPVAVQIVGRDGQDAVVLAVAQALFDATAPIQARWPDAPAA